MTDCDRVLAAIDGDEVVQVAQELIAIPSICRQEARRMVSYYGRWFDDLDIPYREYPLEDGRANFFADYGATEGPGRYLFDGHQDTKPVNGMTVDPFGGEIRDGKLYGRGACDMKSSIAAILCAMKALVRAGVKPKGGITFVSDLEEEWGGFYGLHLLLREGLLDGYDGMVCCEPSNLEIHIGNKGCFTNCYETHGTSLHSGLADNTHHVVHGMSRFIQEYLRLPYLQKENPYFGKPTVNFEKISAGIFESTVPNRCIAYVDSRLIPETPPDMVREEVTALLMRLREEGIDIVQGGPDPAWREAFGEIPAHFITPDHPLAQCAVNAYEAANGEDAVIGGCPGATLGGLMIQHGTPAIIWGPGSIIQAHTEDEWIEVSQIPKAARMYAAMMAGM